MGAVGDVSGCWLCAVEGLGRPNAEPGLFYQISSHTRPMHARSQVTQEESEVGASTSTVTLTDTRNKMTAGSLTVTAVAAVFAFGGHSQAPAATAAAVGSSGGHGTLGRSSSARGGGSSGNGGVSQQPALQGAGQQLAVVTGTGKLYVLREVRCEGVCGV